jgi:hypothetical protein
MLLWTFSSVKITAQDVETQYLQLQSSYTQRLNDIIQRDQLSRRELLNKYILALVRIEQEYRDDGDLDGVVYCRALRETLLTQPGFPATPEAAPKAIADLYLALEQKIKEHRASHQKELHQLNLILFNALDIYQKEFARQGIDKRANEILEIRKVLSDALVEAQAEMTAKATVASTLSVDPNVLPFCLEGESYGTVRGVIPRRPMVDLLIEEKGLVNKVPLGYRFVNGQLYLPSNQSGPLMEDLARNRLLSVELAFQPSFDLQGGPGEPVLLFQIGENLNKALFALTMEGQALFMYLKTDTPPPNRENYRYEIGRIQGLDPVHIIATYRQGELTVYVNGTVTLALRNQVKGTLNNWQPTPVILGKSMPDPERGFILPFRGILHHVYLKAGEINSRQAVANYNRFLLLFEE